MKEGKAYIGDEIVEGNKLIAEFMGATMNEMSWYKGGDNPYTEGIIYDSVDSPTGSNHFVDLNDIKYHSSWDWLHPVILKIRALWNAETLDLQLLEEDSDASRIRDLRVWCEIESAWLAVIDFIQWYNTQTKKQ